MLLVEFQVTKESGIDVITLTGRIDVVTAPIFEKCVRDLAEGGVTRLIVNLEKLEYISSAGLRVLIIAGKLLDSKGGAMRFAAPQGLVQSVLKVSNFGSIFTISDSVAAATASFA
jgi:anti-anti-sigma factor